MSRRTRAATDPTNGPVTSGSEIVEAGEPLDHLLTKEISPRDYAI